MDNDNTKQKLPLKRKAIYWCIVIFTLIALNALLYTCISIHYNRNNDIELQEEKLSDQENSEYTYKSRKKLAPYNKYGRRNEHRSYYKTSARSIESKLEKFEKLREKDSIEQDIGIIPSFSGYSNKEDSNSKNSRLDRVTENFLHKVNELRKTWDLVQSTPLISKKVSSFSEINKKVESFLASRRQIHSTMTEIESIKMDYFAIKSISFDKYDRTIINDFFNKENILFARANNEFFERLSRIDSKDKYDYKDIKYVLEPIEKLRTDERIKDFVEEYIINCSRFLEIYR